MQESRYADVSDSSNVATDAVAASARKDNVLELPHEVLSFREHLWDRFDIAWDKRVEPTRRLLEDLVLCLKERAQFERQYAKNLSRNAERLEQHFAVGCDKPGIATMMVAMKSRAEQSARFADELEQEVLMTIETMLKQHIEISKRVHHDGHRLSRHWLEARRAHETAAANYAKACFTADSGAKAVIKGSTLQGPARSKLAVQVLSSSSKAIAEEREYYKAVDRRNAATDLHDRQMSQVLGALQEMEEKRAMCLRDAAMKLAVYETSWLRNVQYDLDAAVKSAEAADINTDLQKFIAENRTCEPHPTKVSALVYWDLASAQNNSNSEANLIHSVAEVGEQACATRLEDVRPILQKLFAGDEVETDPIEELSFNLGKPRPANQAIDAPSESNSNVWRAAFCIALRDELARQAPAELPHLRAPEDILHVQMKQKSSFDALVSLFQGALDGCYNEGDAWSGRDLMVFSQKVQFQESDGRIVDILQRVYNHSLWSRVTFWEDVLLVGVAEAYAHQALWRRQQDPGHETVEMPTTAFLLRFVQLMCSFGIKEGQAHDCVRTTLRRHTSRLGSVADAYIDLLKRTVVKVSPAGTSKAATPATENTTPVGVEPVTPSLIVDANDGGSTLGEMQSGLPGTD